MTEYINKENLIKAIEDKRPLNWNDTEAELAEQRVYDDIIDLIKDFDKSLASLLLKVEKVTHTSREEKEEENETCRCGCSKYIFELNRCRND